MYAARSIHSRGCRKRWPICPTPLLNPISTTASTPCLTGAPLGAPTRNDILLYFGSRLASGTRYQSRRNLGSV